MNSKDTHTAIRGAIAKHIESRGIKMHKQLSSGNFLAPATYDERTVYSIDEMNELNSQGFKTETDLGVFLFNALRDVRNYE